MPPVQNTFSIIPDLPSAINANSHGGPDATTARPSRAPMTTKQVKKAYQKANKGPKLSKAEQRRQELFEQDRIRKEFEKEKNQARARAARDKKREKEERERADKKKKGLPLVDVRASQDTIARFVRPNPKRQRRNDATPHLVAGGREANARHPSPSPSRDNAKGPSLIPHLDEVDKENIEPRDEFERGSSAVNLVSIEDDHEVDGGLPIAAHASQQQKRKSDVLEEEDDGCDNSLLATDKAASPKTNREASTTSDCMTESMNVSVEKTVPNLDDSFSTIDFGEEDLFDDFLRKGENANSPPNASNKRIPSQQQSQNPPTEPPPPKPPENTTSLPSPTKNEEVPCPDGRPTEPLLSPHQVASPDTLKSMVKTPYPSGIPEQTKQVLAPNFTANTPAPNVRRFQPAASSLRSFQHPRTPMAPPSGPPKFRPSNLTSTNQPKPPQFLKPLLPSPRTPLGGSCRSRMAMAEQIQEDKPPPSTQLFILSHLDDFLPSPSQEVREIFEEPRRNQVPSMTTSTRLKPPEPRPRVLQAPTISYNRHALSTPIVNPVKSRLCQQVAEQPKSQKAAFSRPIQPAQPNIANAFDFPFFSTQDLLLSSQDVKDIEEDLPPPPPPPKAQAVAPTPQKEDTKLSDPPRRSPKRLFTSSCREMRYKYVLERNKTAAWEGASARQKAREELDEFQALEDARLEALLANPDGDDGGEVGVVTPRSTASRPETSRKHPPDAQPRGTSTPQASFSRPAGSDPHNRSARNSMPSSGSIPGGVTQHHATKPSAAQHTRPGSGGSTSSSSSRASQRPTRPKSSYEAMLELLAKGSAPTPPQPSKKKQPSSVTLDRQIGNRATAATVENTSKRNHTTISEKASGLSLTTATTTMTTTKTATTRIPASQETDYDCGEEWDDDDLLCDML